MNAKTDSQKTQVHQGTGGMDSTNLKSVGILSIHLHRFHNKNRNFSEKIIFHYILSTLKKMWRSSGWLSWRSQYISFFRVIISVATTAFRVECITHTSARHTATNIQTHQQPCANKRSHSYNYSNMLRAIDTALLYGIVSSFITEWEVSVPTRGRERNGYKVT